MLKFKESIQIFCVSFELEPKLVCVPSKNLLPATLSETKSKINTSNATISRLAKPRKTFVSIKNQWQFEWCDFFWASTRVRPGPTGHQASREQFFQPFFKKAFFPNGTNVFKSGPLTKTTIYTVCRVRLRRRNQTKRNLPLAFQFVCGPPSPGAANKLEGKWKVRNRHLCR